MQKNSKVHAKEEGEKLDKGNHASEKMESCKRVEEAYELQL
jgi:hypothetical protein